MYMIHYNCLINDDVHYWHVQQYSRVVFDFLLKMYPKFYPSYYTQHISCSGYLRNYTYKVTNKSFSILKKKHCL